MWFVCLAFQLSLASAEHSLQPRVPPCPALCQCEEDGVLLLVDCSELGLSAVPGDLGPLTSYL